MNFAEVMWLYLGSYTRVSNPSSLSIIYDHTKIAAILKSFLAILMLSWHYASTRDTDTWIRNLVQYAFLWFRG